MTKTKDICQSSNFSWTVTQYFAGASCDDIAIIGAGIAGAYTAWKLRHKNLSVKVYEYNNRTGGRLQTVHVPGASDINIELGGMRFIPSGDLFCL